MTPPSSSCGSTHQAISPIPLGTTRSDDSLLALLDRPRQRRNLEPLPIGALSPPRMPHESLRSQRQALSDTLEEALLITQDIEEELWGERQ
jgi:hypothetical protein